MPGFLARNCVVIGPAERTPWPNGPGADEAYFRAHHRLVFQQGDYEVYSID